jgi:hypothetical protein
MVVQHGYINNLQSWAVYKYANHNLVSKLDWLWICFCQDLETGRLGELKTMKNQVHNANSDFHSYRKDPWDQKSRFF